MSVEEGGENEASSVISLSGHVQPEHMAAGRFVAAQKASMVEGRGWREGVRGAFTERKLLQGSHRKRGKREERE